jgi:gliding motility-associated-like protein
MNRCVKPILPGLLTILFVVSMTNPVLSQGSDPVLIIEQHEFYMCSGDTVQIGISVEGIPPIAVRYYYGFEEFIVNSNTNDIELTIDEPGSYIITGFKDFFSAMIDTLDTIHVLQYPAPVVYFTGGGHSCDVTEVDPLEVHFEGEPPFTLIYRLNGISDTITTSEASYTFELPYDFIVITETISDINCVHEFIDTAYAQTGNIPPPVIEGDTSACAGSTGRYSVVNGIYTAVWSIPGVAVYDVDSATNGSFVLVTWTTEGEYVINLKLVNPGNECESPETHLSVVVYPAPFVHDEVDTAVCIADGETLIMNIEAEPDETVFWPSLDYTGNSVSIGSEGNYPYIKTNSYGCSDTSAINVAGNCLPTLYVPEAFTPNEDGINDYLVLFGVYTDLIFSVYSPSGLLLYRSENDDVMWDGTVSGKQLPDGNYFWHAKFSDNAGRKHEQNGSITIIH